MKRTWAVWAASILLAALLLARQSASAAGDIYFVALEGSILPVTEEDMPFWSRGHLYISTAIFTGSYRDSLGISAIHNTARRLMILEKDRRAILFDLDNDMAQDGTDGTVFTPGALERGGRVFLPASVVAEFFGLQYSVTQVSHGYLLWIRQADFGISATAFANAAAYNMEERYAAYLKSLQSAQPEPSPPSPPAADRGEIRLWLSAGERTASLLDALQRAGGWATFFCTAEFMENDPTLLRRIIAEGHGIGLLAEDASPEALRRGSDALWQATFSRTRLVLVLDKGQDLAALELLGWRCLQAQVDRSGYRLETASHAAAALERVMQRGRNVSLWLDDTAGEGGLRAFVSAAAAAGYHCRAQRETG